MTHQLPRYSGGLVSVPQRQTRSTSGSASREIEALSRDVDKLWQEVARLQEPSPPPDYRREVANVEDALRALTKRIAALESGIQARIDKARQEAMMSTGEVVADVLREHISSAITRHGERIDALEAASASQARTIDDTVGALAKQHREVMALAGWQIDVAAETLMSGARDHVREH